MLELRNRMRIPNGGWIFPRNWNWNGERYTDPIEDGKPPITGGDFPELVSRITEVRIVNNLPLGNAEAEAMDWICRHSGAPCAPPKPTGAPRRTARGMDVVTFLRAMKDWALSAEIVPQEEAERRAEICAGCNRQGEIDDGACLGCFGMIGRIMQIIGQRKTRVDAVLRFCTICGCSNALQCFLPISILHRAHRPTDFPEDTGQKDADGNTVPCWKRVAQ